jgi:hypothetical protein
MLKTGSNLAIGSDDGKAPKRNNGTEAKGGEEKWLKKI